MSKICYCLIFMALCSMLEASHFLGGAFTYRPISVQSKKPGYGTILVEIRFHISNHYYFCTAKQVNQNSVAYLLGQKAPYDAQNETYLWHQADLVSEVPGYYKIKCFSGSDRSSCTDFDQEIWAYCESSNPSSGYSILRRQFALEIDLSQRLQLYYSSCCWSNSNNKQFDFNLIIENKRLLNNTSPYPFIPASYYVDLKKPKNISIFVYDADNDGFICKEYETNLDGFLTVQVDERCQLSYEHDRSGKQFGQFWLIDRRLNIFLSESLVSVQVHVLEDITCHQQPTLKVVNQLDGKKKSTIKLNQSVFIIATLDSNCKSILPQNQTITELTTMCKNQQPIVTANGGIQMKFQCQPDLCQKHQVCFIGEFSLLLPSTSVECFIIDVQDTGESLLRIRDNLMSIFVAAEDEEIEQEKIDAINLYKSNRVDSNVVSESKCRKAMKEYDFLRPHHREFVIADPVTTSHPALTTTILPMVESTASLSSQNQSWFWPVTLVLVVSGLGMLGYFRWKKRITPWIQSKNRPDAGHRASNTRSYHKSPTSATPNSQTGRNSIDLVITTPKGSQTSTSSTQNFSMKSQYVRQGPFNEEDI